jgi:hypothetical protein
MTMKKRGIVIVTDRLQTTVVLRGHALSLRHVYARPRGKWDVQDILVAGLYLFADLPSDAERQAVVSRVWADALAEKARQTVDATEARAAKLRKRRHRDAPEGSP